MMINYSIKKIIPKNLIIKYRYYKETRSKNRVASLPVLSDSRLHEILVNEIGLRKNDIVFIHISLDRLNIDFPFLNILAILRDIVGEDGTLLFPTYNRETSYEFLKAGKIFDIRKTPTYTGLLNEFARRHKSAVRSLHPTKSVVAIGPLAKELTKDHQYSPYPYDTCSPYYNITQHNGKIIGIGVKTTYLSCVHCVDDYLKESFPVQPYHKRLFEAPCVDYEGKKVVVNTYAHNLLKMKFDLPGFMKKNIAKDICEDLEINGMDFFRADASKLIEAMLELARNNITIYKKIFYKWNKMI